MKTQLMGACLLAVSLLATTQSHACDPKKPLTAPRPGGQVAPVPQAPQSPAPPVGVGSRDLPGDAEPIWDLPGDPASRSKAPPTQTENTPRTAPAQRSAATQTPIALSERLMQAGAARQALAANVLRLSTKRGELVRWDPETQQKFLRVFGSTDDAVRKRVLDRLDLEIDKHVKLIAEINENMGFELYLQTKRNK